VILVALILFALAATGGVIMAVMRFSGRSTPPLGLAVVHGLAAASGLVVLIAGIAMGTTSTATTVGLVLMVIAALGGFVLLSNHLRKKDLPIPIMVIHGLVAVAGFVTLLLGAAM
jgi:hypothetical protein